MLSPETMERLRELRLSGFIDALVLQSQGKQYKDLSFEERLTLLVDAGPRDPRTYVSSG